MKWWGSFLSYEHPEPGEIAVPRFEDQLACYPQFGGFQTSLHIIPNFWGLQAMPTLSRGGVRAFSQSRLKNNTLPCASARDAFETCLPGSAPPAPRDHPRGCASGGGVRFTASPPHHPCQG